MAAKKKPADESSPLVNAVRRLKRIQRNFLLAYCKCGNITQAAEASGCDRTSHYNWLESEDYKFAFTIAEQQAVDYLEQEARRRAVEGVRRLKFHQGQPVMVQAMTPDGAPIVDEKGLPVLVPYVEHEYSDTLLIFLLKAKRPAEFRERHHVEVDQTVSGELHHVHSAESRRDRLAALSKRLGVGGLAAGSAQVEAKPRNGSTHGQNGNGHHSKGGG